MLVPGRTKGIYTIMDLDLRDNMERRITNLGISGADKTRILAYAQKREKAGAHYKAAEAYLSIGDVNAAKDCAIAAEKEGKLTVAATILQKLDCKKEAEQLIWQTDLPVLRTKGP